MGAMTESLSDASYSAEVNYFPMTVLLQKPNSSLARSWLPQLNTGAAVRGYAFITRKSQQNPTAGGSSHIHLVGLGNTGIRQRRGAKGRRQLVVLAARSQFWPRNRHTRLAGPYRTSQISNIQSIITIQAPTHQPIQYIFSQMNRKSYSFRAVSTGIPARDIQTYLRRQSPNSLATRRDIYNRITEVKDGLHEGQSSINALIIN